jgi:hypothetical protein
MTDDLVKRLREKAFRAESCEMLETAADRIEKLEAALEKISRERTLWGAMRKADHALGKFDHQALEGKDD